MRREERRMISLSKMRTRERQNGVGERGDIL